MRPLNYFLALRNKYTAIRQLFCDPETKNCYEYTLFDSTDKPAIVLPVTRTGHVIAIRQFRHGANDIILELPGGNADSADESPEAVVIREMREETGYTGTIISLHRTIWLDPCVYTVAFSPFLALDCEKMQDQHLDPEERIHITHIPLKEWIYLACISINDSKTMAVTLASLPYLARIFPIAKYISAIGKSLSGQ